MSLSISLPKYLRSLDSFQGKGSTCPYCANEISTKSSGESICNFCEMPSDTSQWKKLRSDIHGFITAKNNLISKNSWAEAAKLVEQAIAIDQSPHMLYSSGIFYEAYSNYEWHSVDYNLKGYMEENSMHRELSWQLLSRSKTLIYHTIKMCHDTLTSEPDYHLAYVKLIAETRMKRMAQARSTLSLINSDPNPSTRKDYANMVYYSCINDTKNAILYIDSVSNTQINAFYYLSKLLVNNSMTEDAKAILVKLNNKANIPKARELLIKILESENTA